MVERRLSDPYSMVGATAEELLALKPAGWLVRPRPPGREGFRMIAPGVLPGSEGSISWHGATPEYLSFDATPDARVFVLNEALESPALSELLNAWAGQHPEAFDDVVAAINALSEASAEWIETGRAVVYEDPLVGDSLNLLAVEKGLAVVRTSENWWRGKDADQAQSVYLIDITDLGRAVLRGAAKPRRRRFLKRLS